MKKAKKAALLSLPSLKDALAGTLCGMSTTAVNVSSPCF